MTSFSTYLQNEKMRYYSFCESKILKQKEFLNKLTVLNLKTGELRKLDYNFQYKQRDTSLWYTFVSTYLQNQANNENKIAIFITLTLDSQYHVYKKSKFGNKHVYNKKYSKEFTINKGYRKLNDAFRAIIKDFKVDRKYVSLQYFRVIEPHSDFTPHLHALIYVSKENVTGLVKHIKNQIKFYGLGKQYKIEVLRDTNAGTSYILKYIKKTLFNENISELYVLDGWKRYNKIRLVTHSQIPVPRYLFEKISKNIDLDFALEHYDIIQNLLDNVNFTINYFNVDDLQFPYQQKKNIVIDKKYNVIVDIEVKEVKSYKYDDLKINSLNEYYAFIDKLNSDDFDFYDLMLFQYDDFDYLGELCFLSFDYDFVTYFKRMNIDDFLDLFLNYVYDKLYTTRKIYKIKNFTIAENKNIIYDKNDFIII